MNSPSSTHARQNHLPEKTQRDLEWGPLLKNIARGCAGEPGRRRIESLALANSPSEATRRVRLARSALALLVEDLALPTISISPLELTLDELAVGRSLLGEQLRELATTLRGASKFASYARTHQAVHPTFCEEFLFDTTLNELAKEIAHCIGDDNEVLDRASDELGRARQAFSEVRRDLIVRLKRVLNKQGEAMSGDFYTERDGRYVVPVRADAPFRVEGIILGSSGSGQTLYVEPKETTALGNRLRVEAANVERECARVLTRLSSLVKSQLPALREAFETCVRGDVLGAISGWAMRTESIAVEASDSATLNLEKFRHPLLLDGETAVVANDLRLGEGAGVVFSGPNAGGKTVSLKCLGLAALMVRAGLPIPAGPGSVVGWFEIVLTDIGDEQSIERSLSTFSAQVVRISEFIAASQQGVLILLDELAGGTDPTEGASLAIAILEELTARGASVAVTTHYDQLKQLGARSPRFENASVGFDSVEMQPTYEVTFGVPGASSALMVASHYGIEREILDRAETLLGEENRAQRQLLQQLESERQRAQQSRLDTETEATQQREASDRLRSQEQVAHDLAQSTLRRDSTALGAELQAARRQLRDAQEKIRTAENDSEIRVATQLIEQASGKLAIGSSVEKATRVEPQAKQPNVSLVVGAQVYVERIGAKAKIIEAARRGTVKIAGGSMTMKVKLSEIRGLQGAPPAAAKTRARKPAKRLAASAQDSVRTERNTVDLRGIRVEAGLTLVEEFVDRMLTEGEDAGFVLHGHGTGAMRDAVREYLATCAYVASSIPADKASGGDAFTVFTLKS